MLKPGICVAAEMLQKFPHAVNALNSRHIPFFKAGTERIISGEEPDLGTVSALITATETSLRPHRAAYELTRRANHAGILTYTLQHGFENVGLTYFDHIQTSALVEFASQKIFIWGPIDRLHPEARPETKARCIPVGCCKLLERSATALKRPGGRARFIAVFENLHWQRYDPVYSIRFLTDMEETARKFQDTTFFIKPHPAGKWLTGRYKGTLPQAENLVIANPEDSQWEPYTSTALIELADGVVTTPSTVALDAARLGCPVAVVAYDLALKEYKPLPLIRSRDDWGDFLQQLLEQTARTSLMQKAAEFLNATLIPGDAARRIINRIAGDIRPGLFIRGGLGAKILSGEDSQ